MPVNVNVLRFLMTGYPQHLVLGRCPRPSWEHSSLISKGRLGAPGEHDPAEAFRNLNGVCLAWDAPLFLPQRKFVRAANAGDHGVHSSLIVKSRRAAAPYVLQKLGDVLPLEM
jgi:hypothetical protein